MSAQLFGLNLPLSHMGSANYHIIRFSLRQMHCLEEPFPWPPPGRSNVFPWPFCPHFNHWIRHRSWKYSSPMSSVYAGAQPPVEGRLSTVYAVLFTLFMIIAGSKVTAYRRNLKVWSHPRHWESDWPKLCFTGCELFTGFSRPLPSKHPTGSLYSDGMVEPQFLLCLELAWL